MATSRMLSDVQPELQAPKSAWHTLLSKHHDAFANLVWYLVADEALVESVMLRALTRLEIMPFDSSDASLTYNQAHSVMIGEAIAQLKETPDPRAPVSVGDLLDLQRLSLSAKHVRRRHARRSLPERLDRDDILSLPTKFKLSTEVGGIRIPDTPL